MVSMIRYRGRIESRTLVSVILVGVVARGVGGLSTGVLLSAVHFE